MQAGFESDASGAVGVPSPRRVTFVLTDPPTAEEARDGGALAPRELLAAAGAVRGDEGVRAAGVDRFGVLDRRIERLSEAGAAERARAAGAFAVVLSAVRAGRPAGEGLDDLIGVGRRLAASDDPVRIALIGDRREDAEAILRARAADVVLLGEPGETLPRAVERAALAPSGRRKSAWEGLRGAWWREANGELAAGAAARPAPPDEAPAWDLVDLDRYASPAPEPGVLHPARTARRAARAATIVTSRACAPGCRTCHQSFGSSARDRDARDVIAEIRDLVHRRGVRRLVIADHGFDGRPARAAEIARAVARLRSAPGRASLSLSFPNGLRGDGLTPEVVEAFTQAGVRRFPLRVVTASRRLQRLLKSNIDLAEVARGIERVAAAGGALAHLELRLGLPTETAGEAAATIRWARSTRAHTAAFLPGREVDLGPAWTAVHEDDLDDFPALRRRALLAFYSRPRRAALLSRSLPRILPEFLSGGRPPLARAPGGIT